MSIQRFTDGTVCPGHHRWHQRRPCRPLDPTQRLNHVHPHCCPCDRWVDRPVQSNHCPVLSHPHPARRGLEPSLHKTKVPIREWSSQLHQLLIGGAFVKIDAVLEGFTLAGRHHRQGPPITFHQQGVALANEILTAPLLHQGIHLFDVALHGWVGLGRSLFIAGQSPVP